MSAYDFTARALAMRATALTPLTFAELQQAQLPETVGRIASSGHAEPASGAAVYVADSLADAALQAAHPAAVFSDNRGRRFRLACEEQGSVKPEQLGWSEGETDSGRIFTDAWNYQRAIGDGLGLDAAGAVELTAGRTYRLSAMQARPLDPQFPNFQGCSFLTAPGRLRGCGATLQGVTGNVGPMVMAHGELLSRHVVVGPMAAGSKVFQLATVAEAVQFAPGDMVKWRLGDMPYDLPETINWGWAKVEAVDIGTGQVTLDRHLTQDWDGSGTNNRHLRRMRPLTGSVIEDVTVSAPSEATNSNLVYGIRIYNGWGVSADNLRGINSGAGTVVVQDCEDFTLGYVEGRSNAREDHASYGRGITIGSSRGRIEHLAVSDCQRFAAFVEFACDVTIGFLHDVVANDGSGAFRHRAIYAGSSSRVHVERALFQGKGGFLTHEAATGGTVTFGEVRVETETHPYVVPAPGHHCDRLELSIDGAEELYIGHKARWIERTIVLADGMNGLTEATGRLDFEPGCVIACHALFGGGTVAADLSEFRIGRPSSPVNYVANLVPTTPSTAEVNCITAYTWGFYAANETRVNFGAGAGNAGWFHRAERAQVRIATPAGTNLAGSGKYVTVRMLIVPNELAAPLASAPNLAKQPFDAKLAALAGLTGAAGKVPYFTGARAMATADIAGLPQLIEEWTADGTVGTRTFGSLGSYRDLFIDAQVRSDRAAASDTLSIRFNGDTAANYDQTRVIGQGDAASSTQSERAQSAAMVAWVTGGTAPAGEFASVETRVPGYRSAKRKQAMTDAILKVGEAADSELYRLTTSAWWRSTAAITSLTLFLVNGPNFAAGSTIRIWGRN